MTPQLFFFSIWLPRFTSIFDRCPLSTRWVYVVFACDVLYNVCVSEYMCMGACAAVHMCICVHVCACMQALIDSCMSGCSGQVIEGPSPSLFTFFFSDTFLIAPGDQNFLSRWTGQQVPRILLFPPPPVLGLQAQMSIHDCYLVVSDLNLGLHAYVASALIP